jgi:hypothetical protein
LRTTNKAIAMPTPQQGEDIGLAMVMFTLSQGFQFARLLPSDLLTPGSCRKQFVDATTSYATKVERAHLFRAFARDGCHSCGKHCFLETVKRAITTRSLAIEHELINSLAFSRNCTLQVIGLHSSLAAVSLISAYWVSI